MTQNTTAPSTTSATDSIVKCVKLTKIFRDFWLRNRVTAVDEIDLDIHRGEVFGLLGPNGSGKSTTIKMLLGLLHPTAGRIAVFGRHPRDVKIKEQIGYLPEESYLYRFLNARETLDYYGRLFHQDRRKRGRRADQLLEYVGLDRVARRPVGEYSKGMQRRIGLAQALINDPQLLILDEPTTGMDPIGTRQIKDLILDLRDRGKTILLCSHLLADVEDVTDRVAIMFGGRVRKAGRITELLEQRDMTSFRTGTLDDRMIAEVEMLLQQNGHHLDRVEHPRQKLEELFLQIVHEAQQEGLSTSGATSGGRIAEFLTDEQRSAHMPEGTDPHRLLDELTADRGAPAPAGDADGAAPDDGEGEPRERRVLDQLVSTDDTPAVSDRPEEPEPAGDRSIIERLLREDEKQK